MHTRALQLIVIAGMSISPVRADNVPTPSSTAQSAPRPGLRTQDRLTAAAATRTDFLMTHGNYAQTRFHRADRINRETVKNLKLAWSFEMDVTESIQSAPIVYDGVMYVTSSFNHLFALYAKTGKELWRYVHTMAPAVSLCCPHRCGRLEQASGRSFARLLDHDGADRGLRQAQGYSATPRVRGQTAAYLTTTIGEFRDGKRRNSPGMADLMRAYSADDVKALVAYLSSAD